MNIDNFSVRRGVPANTEKYMGQYISTEDMTLLVERWKWREPLIYPGNLTFISCEMVSEVGYQELSKVYGVRKAKLFTEVAEKYSVANKLR